MTTSSEPAAILVIDDDAMARALVARRLKREGFQVDQTASGERGLELLESRSYALVILDVIMPTMSGLEFLVAARARFGTTHPPIIVISAEDYEGRREQCLELGAAAFLYKPVAAKPLMQTVRRVLNDPPASR